MENIPNNPLLKQPISFEEQIDLLISRGLIVEDRDAAISILKRINYYRLTAYTLSLKVNDTFHQETSFWEICALYHFDQSLRALLMPVMETVEIAFRTHIAYFLSHKYGNVAHLDKSIFCNEDHYKQFREDLEKEVIRSNEVFVEHHNKKYSGNFPLWVVIELLSFGTLSKMFRNLKKEDSDFICKEMYHMKSYYARNWLHALSVTRNICAHYGRLYNRFLPIDINLFKEDKLIRRNSFFALNLVLKRLVLDAVLWDSYIISLAALIEKYDCVDIKRLGFPNNWEKILKKSVL